MRNVRDGHNLRFENNPIISVEIYKFPFSSNWRFLYIWQILRYLGHIFLVFLYHFRNQIIYLFISSLYFLLLFTPDDYMHNKNYCTDVWFVSTFDKSKIFKIFYRWLSIVWLYEVLIFVFPFTLCALTSSSSATLVLSSSSTSSKQY